MKVVKLPAKFLLKDKFANKTISALSEITHSRNKLIGINFSEIEDTRKSDVMVLAAQLEKSANSYQNRFFREGALPSKKIKKVLFSSDKKLFHQNMTITFDEFSDSERQRLLNPTIIDTIVTDLKKIGIKENYTEFNVFLTELIGNAVEHGIKNKKINWWLTHEIDYSHKIVKYTFVDMGQGIVQSHRKAGLPFKYLFLNDNRVVLDSFSGNLGSSTKQANRGRGLPQLMGMIENEFVSNLVLITNKVSLSFLNNKFTASANPDFVGTYFSWTIDQNNFQKWKNTK